VITNRTRQPGRSERTVFWLIILALTILLIKTNWLWRLDHILYDAHLQVWSRPAPEDIIIVAIDEESLNELGRWPWPRDIHARLIDTLTEEKARAIALDIIFSEPSVNDTLADRKLAQAISKNAKTTLAMLVEQPRSGGQLIETLPISILANSAASLGHVDVELDKDGIARSVFLQAGLGTPHWPNFGLALLQNIDPAFKNLDMGTANPLAHSGSPLVWARDRKMLIAYAGPPGHFQRISYAQVLKGEFSPGTFNNKLVLVGTTATGLGDALPTPVAQQTYSMPGVEINANIIDTIRQGINLRILPVTWQMFISILIILIPAMLFAHLTPRWNLIVTICLLGITLLGSFLLLRMAYIWFPPSPVILTLMLSYPLWSWRRLENTMRYLNLELAKLHSEQTNTPSKSQLNIHRMMPFLSKMLPVSGWSLYSLNGQLKEQHGEQPHIRNFEEIPENEWYKFDHSFWLDMTSSPALGYLGLRWDSPSLPDHEQQALMNDLLERYQSQSIPSTAGTVELVQARIQQVQQATDRLRALRQFILDVISQMADGVLVVDPFGDITLANDRAINYLGKNESTELNGTAITDALAVLQLNSSTSWFSLLKQVLLEHKNVQVDTRHTDGRDLLVQIAPLDRNNRELGGFIVNLSDISPLKASERKRSELLGFLSHDLRSPLVSLLALLEISSAKNTDKEQQSLLDRMEAYTNNTLNLAEEFLQLARAESKDNTNFNEIDLATICYNALEHVWAQAQKKHILLTRHIKLDEAWIVADAGLLERALVNLLNNAIKYSPENTEITLSLCMKQGKYYCCVSDQGNGISDEDIPKLFDRFYRVKDEKGAQEKGAGLGLTFVQTVAERHHGEITVVSERSKGSEFCLILPAPENTQ